MIEKLVEEIKNLFELGYNLSITAFQGLGYKEIIGYLEQKYSLEEAVRILKKIQGTTPSVKSLV